MEKHIFAFYKENLEDLLSHLKTNEEFCLKDSDIWNRLVKIVRIKPQLNDSACGESFILFDEKINVTLQATEKIIQNLNSIYLPNKVIILKEIKTKKLSIEKLVPFIKDYSQIKNQVTIYICKNQQCQLPTTDITKIKQFLN